MFLKNASEKKDIHNFSKFILNVFSEHDIDNKTILIHTFTFSNYQPLHTNFNQEI